VIAMLVAISHTCPCQKLVCRGILEDFGIVGSPVLREDPFGTEMVGDLRAC
jgi:hypothetical protein